ncbi:hypothetical protein HPB52_020003 [Rhipicephalus sanguineus]|uniref:Peptidase M13 C-terminal domain-containing protein n=1 Tax=Rhipicephalus sanguineus TaxID=34632 RepID=A0A9D4PXM8_RHISA|nr:hypothetical protein HPB52_020003 [Rhipicephalus sanguineus]
MQEIKSTTQFKTPAEAPVLRLEWANFISKYTNGTYTRVDKIQHDIAATELIKKLYYDRNIGRNGLRYLVAWSIFRQLINFTDPYMLRGDDTAEDACFKHIRTVMNLAIVSHYFQSVVPPRMVYQAKRIVSRIRNAFQNTLESSSYLTRNIRENIINEMLNIKVFIGSPGRRLDPVFVEEMFKPLPDAPQDRLFPTWIKARGLYYQYYWKDRTSALYDEEHVGGYSNGVVGGVVLPTGNLGRPIMYQYGPAGLNYGGLGWEGELNSFTDSENICDLAGTKLAYKAFASLPPKYRDVKLVGLNMTSEQLFFVNYCVSLCAHRSDTGSQYAPFRKRCIVPLRNMPEFSRAFGCAEGTLMNPQEKCSIW